MQQPSQAVVQPKFKVLKVLGKGSYGTVYKVQRVEDGGVYAMKETDLTRMGPKERQDAVNEIRVLGSMKHPNVVRHHETFVSGNKLCIVMEYAPAGDLASFLKAAAASKLPLPEATVWQVFLQLCQGMQAIHETCVIHRDVKPANIFMCPDNVVKVGDLGVAKALTKASHAQTVIGTPLYMSPEVWRGLKYGYSSDLWSLGSVLYEMMTYRLPFDARSLNELKNKIIMGSFVPLTPNAPYSAGLVAVCHALLSKDPRKRPTCAAILNSREAAPWLHTVPEAVRMPLPPLDAGPAAMPAMLGAPGPGAANPQLLPTIQVPRDIRLLPHRLPKPDYTPEDAAAGSSSGPRQQPAAPAPAAAPAATPAAPAAAAARAAPAAPSAAAPGGMRAPSPKPAGAAVGVAARPSSAARAGAAGAAAVGGAAARVGGAPSPRAGGIPSPRSRVSPRAGAPSSAAPAPSAASPCTPPGAFGGSPAAAAAAARVRAASPSGALGGGLGAYPGAPVAAGIKAGLAAGVPSAAVKVGAAGARVPSAGRVAAAGAVGGAGIQAGLRPAGKPTSAAGNGRPF